MHTKAWQYARTHTQCIEWLTFAAWNLGEKLSLEPVPGFGGVACILEWSGDWEDDEGGGGGGGGGGAENFSDAKVELLAVTDEVGKRREEEERRREGGEDWEDIELVAGI